MESNSLLSIFYENKSFFVNFIFYFYLFICEMSFNKTDNHKIKHIGIKYFMEKLIAVKKDKTEVAKTDNKNKFEHNNANNDGNNKTGKKIKKTNTRFKTNQKQNFERIRKIAKKLCLVFKQNKFYFVLLFFTFLISLVLSEINFNSSKYFLFLNRPKIFSTPKIFIALLVVFLFLLFFCGSLLPFAEKNFQNKKNGLREKQIVFVPFLFLLFSILFFNLELLPISVILLFFNCFCVFLMFFRQKMPILRIFLIILLLSSICLWISFYFLYLLN